MKHLRPLWVYLKFVDQNGTSRGIKTPYELSTFLKTQQKLRDDGYTTHGLTTSRKELSQWLRSSQKEN